MADYQTFENIYQNVCRAIADSQYARLEEVKAIVNMVYLNEVCQCDEIYPLFWLLECDDARTAKPRSAITNISQANPAAVTAVAHGLATNDLVTLYGILGMTELNYRTFKITKTGDDSFTVAGLQGTSESSVFYHAYTSGGYVHHRGTLITSCQKVISANWHGYNKGLAFIGPEQIEAESAWMDQSTSRPLKIMHRRVYASAGTQYDYLLWFQAPDKAYNLRLWYEKQCARLSSASDVPILPYQFHDALVSGAITRLGENKVQVEAGIIWPGLYKAQIEAIKTFNRKYWNEQKPYERSGLFLA